ncbi:3-hydroxyacyl-ACP dehydratase FabZ family protein [Stratiformator vulcanicus]|uniref:3-hydroxyacyl-[acyl-carrier-protein] dehydratase FabZ n=1 Tax=Stratiformator vulcanicus TaxID=2527980 RepID=A0A517R0J8_9PLAN|nr:3-hydroxyacyl-ACP dehydratase FabZ family protein [Stratiformator vulcanicus]QDT37425.1 3-hydroxyacyl-[acyl-carrier-protein] dehydratase FabZ [Stratiformator vulcanicus]
MRWIWIDRFDEFESGKRAVAVKNVSLAEDHLHDHFPGFPVMPGSLMLEGMAQAGGMVLAEMNDFKHIVVLAKVPKITYHRMVRPGDTLFYEVTLLDARNEGGTVECVARVKDEVVAEGEIMFAHLDESDHTFSGVNTDRFVSPGLKDAIDASKSLESSL